MKRQSLVLLAVAIGLLGANPAPVGKADAEAALERAKTALAAMVDGPSRRVAQARIEDATAALAAGRFEEAAEAAEQAATIAAQPVARVTVVVDETSGSRFLVREGSVEVTSGRTTAVAGPGEMVTATAGSAPRVEKIPVTPPNLLEPAEGMAIDWDDLLRWSRPKGAKRFQVWISRDPLFRDRVSMLAADGTTIAVDPDLETGTYWWRVAALSDDGLESLPSEPRSFRLAPDPDGRLYWVRHMTRACATPPCPRWLAVDTESGTERAVADVDLGLLGLDRTAENRTREQLLAGQMAVRGSIKPGSSPDRAVLVVSAIRGVE